MFEWYCNLTVFLKVGPFILATYGLFVGFMGLIQFWLAVAYMNLFERHGLISMPDMLKAPVGVAAALMVMLGYRLCSMFAEDKHEIGKGHYLRAFLRPGFLEAGGHTFLVIFGTVTGFLVSLVSASSPSAITAVALVDALNIGYYAGFCFLSLGCVTYGCCWGKQVDEGAWWATRYHNHQTKVLRLQPELKGKALFPHATLRGLLFLKNALILMALGHIVYVPGLFSILAPILNQFDKNLYFSRRGDAGGDLVGFCADENFIMLKPQDKKAHCMKWALPDQYFSYVASIVAIYWVATGQRNLPLFPASELGDVIHLPGFTIGAGLSYAICCLTFGYHYKKLGLWMSLPKQAKS